MAEINLNDIFTTDRIKLHMRATDKDEAFEELVRLLPAAKSAGAAEAILTVIRERENKMSTGIKSGIAIPHGKIPGVNEIVGALGISDKGIEYDSLDGKPVHVIFLFTSGESMTDEHLAVLRSIARIAENPLFMEEIMQAHSSEAANGIIGKYDAK